MGNRKTAIKNLQKANKARTSPGRKPGSKNRFSKSVIDRILAVEDKLDKEGKGLEDCALQDPKWFLQHIFRHIIPKNVEIGGKDDGPLEIIIRKV